MKRLLCALLLVALYPTVGYGQASVIQGGSWTAGRVPMYSASGGGSQPVVQQSAPASGGSTSISELSLIARGTGSAPFAGQGTGYLGSIMCLYDGPTTGPYHQLCLSPNSTGNKGLLSYNAFGGASAQALSFNINGSSYEFPAIVGGVAGPASTTVGHIATWNNTTGTLLADGGTAITLPTSSTATLAGTITVDSAGIFRFAGSGSGNTRVIASATASGTLTLPAAIDQLVGRATTDTLTNKTLTAPVIATIVNSGTLTLPTSTDTLVGRATTDTLTNKTLTAPVISTISNTGTLTLPTSTDTLVGKATTDTFTNKTFNTAGTGNVFQIAGQGITAVTGANATVLTGGTQITNSLSGNVSMNNTANFFDGPSIAQGSTGTWFASGSVTVQDTAALANVYCKLWDGTTTIAGGAVTLGAINYVATVALSGYIASPTGNIRISCRDVTSTSGLILFDQSGTAKDATVSAFRIN